MMIIDNDDNNDNDDDDDNMFDMTLLREHAYIIIFIVCGIVKHAITSKYAVFCRLSLCQPQHKIFVET